LYGYYVSQLNGMGLLPGTWTKCLMLADSVALCRGNAGFRILGFDPLCPNLTFSLLGFEIENFRFDDCYHCVGHDQVRGPRPREKANARHKRDDADDSWTMSIPWASISMTWMSHLISFCGHQLGHPAYGWSPLPSC